MNGTIIKNYDKSKTFSSFLPGIAGVKGIPMWCFYVNRGQGIASFGIENKDNSIMEFFPANTIYQNIALNGFRTFIKYNCAIIEPFSESNIFDDLERNMHIGMNELEIEELNKTKGIRTTVKYFTVPEEGFAALSRTVTIQNISMSSMDLEILDGLPSIMPFGVDCEAYKSVGNTLRAWMDVTNIENNVPFYKVRSSTKDTAEVVAITKGNFYLSFIEDGVLLKPIVDKEVIFGYNTALSFPQNFANKTFFELQNNKQYFCNKVSGGFSGTSIKLEADESVTINTLIGHVSDADLINNQVERLTQRKYIESKRASAKALAYDLTNNMETKTSNEKFDQYARQNYLDNVLRGGYPLILGSTAKHVYHVYSRKHGDLERDYNFFSLSPEMYSQGNGNFRDSNQNRRNDVFFNPNVGNFNIKLFSSLIQLDGYNPLVVKGSKFKVKEENLSKVKNLFKIDSSSLLPVECFTPGELLAYIRSNNHLELVDEDEIFNFVLNCSEQSMQAEFGEGFWVDHWTYNMDQIDSYLSIFPEKKHWLLFEDVDYVYFRSAVKVLPRSKKIVSTEKGDRQYNSIIEDHSKDKVDLVKVDFGKGEIFKTNLFIKLLNLALIKFATMDIEGIGIEMEADKPGWNDSLNGLPGLFGSSISESLELKRLMDFILSCCKKTQVEIPVEVYELLLSVNKKLKFYNESSDKNRRFIYWDEVATLREEYREQTYLGISGKLISVTTEEIQLILSNFNNKIQTGIDRAIELGDGLIPTYLRYDILTHKGGDTSEILGYKSNVMPYFLEGPARALKVVKNISEAKDLYNRLKTSNVYDKKLKMYKVCESLDSEPFEIGRARAFTPGWLENESIFLHMSYKYLLAVLKAGLYEEFFYDLKTSLVPMMDPNVYGRSILENSSFIASSANPDDTQHGRGYIARLSGSTAEFIHMWIIMMTGQEPFRVVDDKLQLHLNPVLPASYFDDNKQVQFTFLGHTKVVYTNTTDKDTWKDVHAGSILISNSTETYEFTGLIEEPYASRIRNGDFEEIHVRLE